MQKAISILLILCLTVQTFNRLSIITSYQLNKKFITEVFCVNKAKPVLHCEGKCYLSKQLAQADQQEQNAASDIRIKFDVLYCQDVFKLIMPEATQLLHRFSVCVTRHFHTPVFTFFTPPKC